MNGCAKHADGSWKIPLVYRIDVQQGNVIDQSMINKLKPGMDKGKVRFILGTPLLQDPFHSDRWDYFYSFEPGSGEREQRHIIVYFKEDKLSHLDGDVQVSYAPLDDVNSGKDKTVVVPLEQKKEGFFSKLWDMITPGDSDSSDDETEPDQQEASKQFGKVVDENEESIQLNEIEENSEELLTESNNTGRDLQTTEIE